MKKIILDIETEPLPKAVLLKIMPEMKPSKKLVDPKKIEADLEEKRNVYLETAALRAESSRVCAIGIGFVEGRGEEAKLGSVLVLDSFLSDEKTVLRQLWSLVVESSDMIQWVTFNGEKFDLGFLRQRFFINGMPCPITASRGRYIENSIDVMREWVAGTQEDYVSLKRVANLLGVGDKTKDGLLYYQQYKEDKNAAIEYLHNDIQLTFACAKQMGLL